LSQNLQKLSIYEVRGGLPGAGKVHLKCSNKDLVKAHFASQRKNVLIMTFSCGTKRVGLADQSKHY